MFSNVPHSFYRFMAPFAFAAGLTLTGQPLLAQALGHDHAHSGHDAAGMGMSSMIGHDMSGMSAPKTAEHAMTGNDMAKMDHRMPIHLAMAADGNASIIANAGKLGYKRSLQAYTVPDVTLRDQTGHAVNLADLVAGGEGPVLLNFIFTSCTTICPVMSATFDQVQADIGAINPGYRMISISIDPEYDTPGRLHDYAQMHDAQPNWVFLTGGFDDVMSAVKAFDAVSLSNNKMYHEPLTFLRARPTSDWVRIEGLLSAEELTEEYASLAREQMN